MPSVQIRPQGGVLLTTPEHARARALPRQHATHPRIQGLLCLRAALLPLALLLLAGCTALGPGLARQDSPTTPPSAGTPAEEASWAQRGRALAPNWRGTAPDQRARPESPDTSTDILAVIGHALSLDGSRYRPGGIDPSTGFDCSGFVSYVYARAGIELPHSSSAQFDRLPRIERGALRPGDLVYFRTGRGKRISHVGLFLGGDRFIHASSSRSRRVMVSSLSERYWDRHWAGARRVPGPHPIPGQQGPGKGAGHRFASHP